MSLEENIGLVVERIAEEFKTVRIEIAAIPAPDLSGYATTQALTDSFLTLNTKDGTMIPKYPTFPEMGEAISQVEMWASENFGNVPTRDEMNTFLAERPQIDTVDAWLQAKADITYVDAQIAALGGGSGGAAIDDTTASTTTVYSSSKVDSLIDGAALVTAFNTALNS